MVLISKIYVSLLIALLTNYANGLKCHFCTSSNSIYNENCQYGTNTLPSGDCPAEFTSCVTRYAEDATGDVHILRDCSRRNYLAPWNYPIEMTTYCDFDKCNVGYVGESGSTTTSRTTTTTSNSAIGGQNTIPIWILVIATALRYI
ncbi:uncharacterized protein LOC130687940 [Daphnia carinata]|uniref:uncharacterized protein LOC130687940 n=1 Tax=Daphnia carinata TaxID=120202 RepID=UPI00257ACC35|nr:uncharacterized protein LOC130687940 [Daphnia carinata]